MNTRYYRDRNGPAARDVADLGFEDRELHVETSKTSRGLTTTASVVKRVDGGFQHVFSFSGSPDDDFRAVLGYDKLRATEKNVRDFHAANLTKAGGLDALVERAKAFYAGRKAVA